MLEFDRCRSVWNPIATMKGGSLQPLRAGGWKGREVHRRTVSRGREALGDLTTDPLGFAVLAPVR